MCVLFFVLVCCFEIFRYLCTVNRITRLFISALLHHLEHEPSGVLRLIFLHFRYRFEVLPYAQRFLAARHTRLVQVGEHLVEQYVAVLHLLDELEKLILQAFAIQRSDQLVGYLDNTLVGSVALTNAETNGVVAYWGGRAGIARSIASAILFVHS